MLELSFCYISFERQEDKMYRLIIRKGNRFTSIYIRKSEDKKIWEEKLSKICIKTNFHMSYTPHYKIGKGAFGSVYKIADQDGKIFAAKSIKKRSRESSKFENQ